MTETAIGKWRDLMSTLERDAAHTHLRLSIKGGGCSGFMKELDFVILKILQKWIWLQSLKM